MKSYQYIIDLVDKATKPLEKVQGKIGVVAKKVGQINGNLSKFHDKLKQSQVPAQKLVGTFKPMASAIAGAFAVSGVTQLGNEVIHTLASFEKMEAVLTNTLGSSSAAQKALEQIKNFAATTPFQIDELGESFVKMANQNFTPTMSQMKSLGDLAASTGKGFDQLAEAVLDARMLEFERLKDFSIKAKKVGDNIVFNFKGQATKVAATEDAVTGYLLSIGKMKGVMGSMDAISKTTVGQLSNLAGKFTELKLGAGRRLKPAIELGIQVLGGLIDFLPKVAGWVERNAKSLKILAGLFLLSRVNAILNTAALIAKAAVLGILSVRTFAYNVLLGVGKIVMIGYRFATLGASAAMLLFKGALLAGKLVLIGLNGVLAIARIAMIGFNVVMMANPIGAVIAAVSLLIGGLVLLYKTFPIIGSALKGFFQGVVKWFGKAKDWIFNNFIKPVMDGISTIQSWLGFGEDPKPIAVNSKGESVTVNEAAGVAQDGFAVEGTNKIESILPNAEAGGFMPSPVKLGNSKSQPQSTSAVSGGGAKNVVINIQSLVEKLVINTTSGERPVNIKAEVERVLLQAVNSVNHVAS